MARFYQQPLDFNFLISDSGDRSYEETAIPFNAAGTEADNTYRPGEIIVKTATAYVKFTGAETGRFLINCKRAIATADEVTRLVFLDADAEVKEANLVFAEGLTSTEIAAAKAALADQGVKLR